MTKNLHIDTQAMRAKILDLAIQGKLTDQRAEDGNAQDLLKEIQAEKEKLIKEKKIKKEKPLPEITEEEKPFEIPDNWEWVRLGNLTSKVGAGNTPKGGKNSGVYRESGVEFIREMNVYNDGLHYDGMVYISSELAKTRTGSAVVAGDILLNITGGSIGRCALVPDNFVLGNVNQHVLIIRNVVASLREYIHLVLCSPLVQRYINNSAVGDKAGLSASKTKGFVIPLPPLAEQKRIADKVSKLFAQLDAIDKAYEEYRELQQAMKAKLLELAIQGKLTDQRAEDGNARDLLKAIQTEKEKLIKEKKIKKEKPLPEIEADEIPFEIPKNWMWARWGTLSISIKYGYNTSAQKDGKIKMVRISDIQNNQVNWDSVPFCNIPKEEIAQYLLRKNDILFARTGGTVGKSYLVSEVPENVVYAGYLIRTRYSEKLSPQYLKYFMESDLYWSQLKKGTTTTAQPNCNAKTLGKMVLPLPPLAEQKRIVAKLDELLPLL